MKFDDAVKYACNQEVRESNLSSEKADEMLSFIENKVLARESSLGHRVTSKIKAAAFSSPMASFLQVAGFILLLVLIPIVTKSIMRNNAPQSANPNPHVIETNPKPQNPPENAGNTGNKASVLIDLNGRDFENINDVSNKGNVFAIDDLASSQPTDKVYNTDKLDTFINDLNNGTKSSIFIVKYAAQGDKVWVNSLLKLESTGSPDYPLLTTGYDVYSNKDIFAADKPIQCKKISKNKTKDGIRYAAYTSENEPSNMGLTLLSFNDNQLASPITTKDETAIENLILDYFHYLELGNVGKAWEMTSDRSKLSYPKSEALNSHFGLDKVKLIKIEKSNLPHNTSYLTGGIMLYVVTLDVVPGSISSWEEGITQRFVNVVKDSNGNWKIDGLATGP